MKTKTFFAGLIALVFAVVLPSCDLVDGPDKYSVAIEDSFRAQVAAQCFGAVYGDVEGAMDFAGALDSIAQEIYKSTPENNFQIYKQALKQKAEVNDVAKDMLDLYNMLDVEFSEWTKQENDEDGNSVWTATEKVSGIKVIFTNDINDAWDVNLDDETITDEYLDPYIEFLEDRIG